MRHSSSQSGSVFFIIILAIAMFAGLSYAVFKGGAGSGAQLTNDQARLAAQEVIAYTDTIAKAVQTLRLRGCSDTQISFANNVFTAVDGTLTHPDGHNPNAPVSGECDVFKPQGGNVNPTYLSASATKMYRSPPPAGWAKPGGLSTYAIISTGLGTPAHELFIIPAFIEFNVCMKINEILGINNPDGKPPDDQAIAGGGNKYNGTYLLTETVGDEIPQLGNASAFCKSAANVMSPKEYHFYRVVLVR